MKNFKNYFSSPISHHSSQQGFMAFSLILLISAVVLVIVTTVSLVSIGEMQASMGLYYGEDTLDLVEGCAEDAMMKINLNASYTGGSITRPEGTCNVTINSGDPNWDITVSADHSSQSSVIEKQFQRNIRVTFTRSGSVITMTSWREI